MSALTAVREKFQAALINHEQRILLDILSEEFERMTLGELGDILTSDLGKHLRDLSGLVFLEAITARQVPKEQVKPGEATILPRPHESSSATALTSGVLRIESFLQPSFRGTLEELVEAIRAKLAADGPLPRSDVRQAIGCSEAMLAEAINVLRSQRVLERSGSGRGTRYAVVSTKTTPQRPESTDVPSHGVIRRRRPAP